MGSTYHCDDIGSGPLNILSSKTKHTLQRLLDPRKILQSDQKYHRDWRGLAEFCEIDPLMAQNSKESCTLYIISYWDSKGGTVRYLCQALSKMDRYDVIDDTIRAIEEDYSMYKERLHTIPNNEPSLLHMTKTIRIAEDNKIITYDDHINMIRGEGFQYYDALLLYADENSNFVKEMLDRLEGPNYSLKLCDPNRDILPGTFSHESVLHLIKDRCSKVIVIISKSFLNSNMNHFFLAFIQAVSIDRRKRILIPCMLEPVDKPTVISYYHTLDYFRSQHGAYWDFWKKLAQSICYKELAPHSGLSKRLITKANELLPLPPSSEAASLSTINKPDGLAKRKIPAISLTSSLFSQFKMRPKSKAQDKNSANNYLSIESAAKPESHSGSVHVLDNDTATHSSLSLKSCKTDVSELSDSNEAYFIGSEKPTQPNTTDHAMDNQNNSHSVSSYDSRIHSASTVPLVESTSVMPDKSQNKKKIFKKLKIRLAS